MGILGNALKWGGGSADALRVLEATLALRRRYWSYDVQRMLLVQGNIANCLERLGRHEATLVLRREAYAGFVAGTGLAHEATLGHGLNLAGSIAQNGLLDEAKIFARDELLPAARQSLEPDHDIMLNLQHCYADTLICDPMVTRDDLLEAVTIMEDVVQRRRRAFGPAHPQTRDDEDTLSRFLARADQLGFGPGRETTLAP